NANNTEGEAFPGTMESSFQFGTFKGQKAVGILFPDGREQAVSTWKEAAVTILKDCNQKTEMHQGLLELCGRVFGRTRVLLSREPDAMDRPLQIDDGIYLETYFETDVLFRLLREKIFNFIGYDYSGIKILYRTRS
ncbi:MAG: hypothetical protein LUE14_05505, partial [Clostridiales bacterium]|nr:hypothetical protein [Clostridiales bacterium]